MTCIEANELIHLELDGELSSAERELLTAHVAECDPCAELRNTITAIVPALSAACPVEMPSDFTASVTARLRGVRPAIEPAPSPWYRAIVGTVVAYAMAGVAGYTLLSWGVPWLGRALPGLVQWGRAIAAVAATAFGPLAADASYYVLPIAMLAASSVLLAGVLACLMRGQLALAPARAK